MKYRCFLDMEMQIPGSSENGLVENSDVDEEYGSCCVEDEEEWLDTEESLTECSDECLDDNSLRMFFKGVSVSEAEGSGVSGIGVVMERCYGVPMFQVQKKLDFYVRESVAEHLALMDGLLEAMRNGVQRVLAYTDSEEVYDQIAEGEEPEDPLLVALGERIMEHADKLEDFTLKLVCSNKLRTPLRLAQEAAGIFVELTEDCTICCDEKQLAEMVKLNCSHSFCADCMIMYAERKLQTSQVPLRCPNIRCRYCISTTELKDFLPLALYAWLERAAIEAGVLNLERIYCPFPNCSMLIINPSRYLSSPESSSSQSDINCIECPECSRLICVSCSIPWHSSMNCEEYQNLPADERDAGDIILHQLAQNNRWRRCQQCRRMIELTQGCHHITCWCGHEFCYSCGAECRGGSQTCQCAFWDECHHEPSVTASNQESAAWRWESFDALPPAVLDAYSEQERAQLALVHRFLAGGYGIGDHPCQSPPRCSDSYVDTIKDLHQLPWLERFVSVISDNYQENFIQ